MQSLRTIVNLTCGTFVEFNEFYGRQINREATTVHGYLTGGTKYHN